MSETKPTIVCLCGSTRFYQEFAEANYRETMKGKVVLSVGFYVNANRIGDRHGQDIGCTPDEKSALDELHLRKIDMADEVLILNVNGYIGKSTSNELRYAREKGKVIRFLESRKARALESALGGKAE